MSRRIILSLIAGIGIAALPMGVRAADGGDATTQPANASVPATQPGTDAATQPAADANTPVPQTVVVGKDGRFTVTTNGGMAAGPGQVRVIHSTVTITGTGGGNFVIRQSAVANPPATQPADNANSPVTQPADNGG